MSSLVQLGWEARGRSTALWLLVSVGIALTCAAQPALASDDPAPSKPATIPKQVDADDGAAPRADDGPVEPASGSTEQAARHRDSRHRALAAGAVERISTSARSLAEAAASEASNTPPSFRTIRRLLKLDQIEQAARDLVRRTQGDYLVMTPYVSDPRWVEAMRRLKDDECEEALALATEILGEPDEHVEGEPAIRYAFGRIQMCAGQAAQGRQTLKTIADANAGPIGVLARRRLGLPDGSEAAERDEGKHLYERIRHARRAHKGVDDTVEALQTLRAELDSAWYRYRVDRAIVDVYEDAGQWARAGRTLLGVYRVVRDWRVGDEVEAKLEQLQKRAGLTLLPFGERVDRMRDLIARGKYRKAREVSVDNAKLRGVSGAEIRGWSFFRRALEAERKRDREEAAELFEQAEKLVRDPDVRPRLYYGWARALRRLDRDPEAIALYDRICDEYPRHLLCDNALYEAGRLSQYLNDHAAARDYFVRVVGRFPDSEKIPDALWRGAFSAYLMGDFDAAQAPLEHLIAHYPHDTDASELTVGLKASYWLGVSLLKAGDTDRAQAQLQETINRGPLTWYGRLAAARIEQLGGEPVVSIPSSRLTVDSLNNLTTLRIPEHDRLEVAAQYLRLGLFEDAIDELRDQVGLHPVPKRAKQLLAAAHLANGRPDKAHWMMKKLIPETGPTYHTLRDWGTAFPIDYMELSHKYGTRYNVSPFLVQAIIRQESGFRPTVKSYAGAMGLMQLMPGTARYTQRTFAGGGRMSRSDIIDPQQNIRLGTMYIRIHTAHAADQIPMALAGYNAGPAPLESWFERFGERELDAWVESITYREARGYVRKVFTSYTTYAGLYGDGELPDLELTLPQRFRTWGDVPEVNQVKEGDPISSLGGDWLLSGAHAPVW